jgi:hypothetical protein
MHGVETFTSTCGDATSFTVSPFRGSQKSTQALGQLTDHLARKPSTLCPKPSFVLQRGSCQRSWSNQVDPVHVDESGADAYVQIYMEVGTMLLNLRSIIR